MAHPLFFNDWSLVTDEFKSCKAQVGCPPESRHEQAHETDVGEVMDRTDFLFVISQWYRELVPRCHLGLVIASMHIGHLLVGDKIPAYLE